MFLSDLIEKTAEPFCGTDPLAGVTATLVELEDCVVIDVADEAPGALTVTVPVVIPFFLIVTAPGVAWSEHAAGAGVGTTDGDGVGTTDGVGDAEAVGDTEGVGDADGDGLEEGEAEPEGVAPGVAGGVAVGEAKLEMLALMIGV